MKFFFADEFKFLQLIFPQTILIIMKIIERKSTFSRGKCFEGGVGNTNNLSMPS